MRRDGKPGRGWKRDRKDAEWKGEPLSPDPSAIFRELNRRQMRDLETCRQVWEQEFDPLALCEAVRQSNLPEWLTSSLLFVLADGASGRTVFTRRKLWRDRTRDATDAAFAVHMAELRSNPNVPPERAPTWERTFPMADFFAREQFGDLPKLTDSGLKRVYERVCSGIARPWRYYSPRPGMGQRVGEARAYMVGLLDAMRERVAAREK